MWPLSIVGLDATGQCLNTVGTIPFGQMFQKIVHRVVKFNVVRVDIAHDVLVPAFDALRQGIDGDRVAGFGGQVLEVESQSCLHAIFGHATHHVLAQFVIGIQKHVDLHHHQCLRRDVLQRFGHILALVVLPFVLLAIGVLENLFNHIGVLAVGQADECATPTEGHVESRLAAVFGQSAHNQFVTLLFVGNAYGIVVSLR